MNGPANPPPSRNPTGFSRSPSSPGYSSSQTTSPFDKAERIPKPTNHVKIYQPQQAIDGVWNLDLATPPLPYVSKQPVQDDEPSWETWKHTSGSPNLKLSTHSGNIKAVVYIADSSATSYGSSDSNQTTRCAIILHTVTGNINLEIRSRSPNARLHICAFSETGNVVIRLPKDFVGPMHYTSYVVTTNPAWVRITPDLARNTAVISMEDIKTYAFVGDSSRFKRHEIPSRRNWPNNCQVDQLEASVYNGKLKICYYLTSREEKEKEGVVRTFSRYKRESGFFTAVMKLTGRGIMDMGAPKRRPLEREYSGVD